jgi:rubredoxin
MTWGKARGIDSVDLAWGAVCSGCGWVYEETLSRHSEEAADASTGVVCPRCGLDEAQLFLLTEDEVREADRPR